MSQIKYSLTSIVIGLRLGLSLGISAIWRSRILQSVLFGLAMGTSAVILYNVASN